MIGNALEILLIFCVMAIIIIGVKWLAGLAGLTIPPPLMVILGIILFMVFILICWQMFAGGVPVFHRT